MILRLVRYSTICLISALYVMAAKAQSGAGAIQGTIHDPSGARVPGAKVHVSNADTGMTWDTTSNDTGFYVVPSLFTGDYTVRVEASSFKPWEGNVALGAGQTAVVDPNVTIGSSTQQVEVLGDITPLANYVDGTISATLDNDRINQLPMNGRNIVNLVGITTPGVEGQRANGNREAAFEYVQDGAVLVNRSESGTVNQTPDPDAIQEVKVETQNSSAKYNRPATAIITTRSGTNHFHGSLFETARNSSVLGIAKNRQDAPGAAPKYIRNEFGGSIGGPIEIPGLYNGRDRSFFFFAYEKFSLRQGQSIRLTVPTQAMRQGDFSGAVDSQGSLYTIYDSLTSGPAPTYQRTAFPGNKIPASRISPLATAIYKLVPLPTTTDNPLVRGNWVGAAPNNNDVPTYTVRLDHRFSPRDSAYLRFTRNNSQGVTIAGTGSSSSPYYGPPGVGTDAVNLSTNVDVVHSGALSYTQVFSPTFYSETLVANSWEHYLTGGAGNQAINYSGQLGLPNDFAPNSFPQIRGSAIGSTSPSSILGGVSAGNYRSNSSIITNVDENLTKIVGRHQFEFGGRYRHERLGIFPDQTPNNVNFTGSGTALYDTSTGTNYGSKPYTGLAAADFYLGYAGSYSESINQGYYHFRDQEIAGYFQDDYRITDRLTLNLGLRWEAHPAPHERYNAISSFDIATHSVVLGETLDELYKRGVTTPAIIASLQNIGVKFETALQAGLPDALVYSNNANFAPRVGFALRPFGDHAGTVVRGGYGTYIYPPPVRNFYARTRSNPPFTASYTQNYNSANQVPDGKPNYTVRGPQTVVAGQNSSNVIVTSGVNQFNPGIGISMLSPHYPVTYVAQLNATIEQPLKPGAVLRLTYSWDHGSNLEQYKELNQAPSDYVWYQRTGLPKTTTGPYANVAQNPYDNTTWGQVEFQQKTGYSNDNAFQVNYQRLFNKGYGFQFFYVYSSALRNGGNGWRDSFIYPIQDFAPSAGARVSDEDEQNRLLNYVVDTSIPRHRVRWNFLVDLPVGKGKRFLSHSNRFTDELVGGWQIAGAGQAASSFFSLNTGNWGPQSGTHIYNHKYPIQDCRSGNCYKGYQYFNGYLAPNQVNPTAVTSTGSPTGVQGVPGTYVPNQVPLCYQLNPDPRCPVADNSNNVNVTLNNGAVVKTGYAQGPIPPSGPPPLQPYSKTVYLGPFAWIQDLSLFKVFPIKEGLSLRINIDAFNVFNIQGSNAPGSDGIQTFLSSRNTARQLQLSGRLTF